MKASIHPQFNDSITVNCTSCGTKFVTGSTKTSITVETCNNCHPFYTGEQRFLDAKGRVDTFQKKMEVAKKYQSTVKTKKNEKKGSGDSRAKTLRELLTEV